MTYKSLTAVWQILFANSCLWGQCFSEGTLHRVFCESFSSCRVLLSLNCERVCVEVQASLCLLAQSQSPANNVSMAARSPCPVWREMCNLTLVPATQSWPYTHALLCYFTKKFKNIKSCYFFNEKS